MDIFTRFLHWGAGLPPTGLYLFIFAWLFVESTGFPISDEPLLLLAGYLTTVGRVTMPLVIIIALIGKVAASCLAFWVGHYIDFERLARPDAPINGKHRWFDHLRPTRTWVIATEERVKRQGVWGVFLGRLIPVVRSYISYPAGALRMPFPAFFWATTAGSLVWIATWTILGAVLGKSYTAASDKWGAITPFILIGLIVLLVLAWLWNHRRAEAAALRLEAQRLADAARHAHLPHRPHTHPKKSARHAQTNVAAKSTSKK